MTTATFAPGATYYQRSIGDHDCIHTITVAKRTAKTVTLTDGKRLGVSVYDGVEQVKPHGTYSMCCVIGADRPLGGAGTYPDRALAQAAARVAGPSFVIAPVGHDGNDYSPWSVTDAATVRVID